MNSLSKKCQEAKEKYDQCFNTWFSERYLKGHNENECEPLFKVYQKCIKVIIRLFIWFYIYYIFETKTKEAIIENKIELWNLPSEYEQSNDKKHK